jgi:RNA polymerase sigma factor (sigma-70 family)
MLDAMDPLVVPLLRLASDQRLARLVSSGSEHAFEVLYDRHHRPLLAFCRHMLGSIDEAEDALQHTFEAAYRELRRSGAPPAVRPWLFVIARNRCISLLRARRELPSAALPEGGTDRLVADVALREELRAVLAGLTRLPDDQRAALVLSQFGDVAHDEIARILDCRREQVKALVFQARSALAADRVARDTPCADIREQLASARGAQLRRTALRRHVDDCPGCKAFREAVRAQRRQLRALLPVVPALGLKRTVLGAVLAGGGGGGATLGGVAATALIVIAIPAGSVAMARDDAPPVASSATATPTSRPALTRRAIERSGRPGAAHPAGVTSQERTSKPVQRDATTRPADPGDVAPDATPGPPSAPTSHEAGPGRPSGHRSAEPHAPDTPSREPSHDETGPLPTPGPGHETHVTRPHGTDRAPGRQKAHETKPHGTDRAPGRQKAYETKPHGTDRAPGRQKAHDPEPRGAPPASNRASGQAKARDDNPASGQAKGPAPEPRDTARAADPVKPRDTSPASALPAADRATPPRQAKTADPPAGGPGSTPAETPHPVRPAPGNSGSAPADRTGASGNRPGARDEDPT